MREFALIKGLPHYKTSEAAGIFWRSKSHPTSAPILGNMWDIFRIYYISYLKWIDSKDSDHFRTLSFWSSTWVQKTSADLGTSGCSFFQVEPCSPGLDVGCPEWCREIVAVRGENWQMAGMLGKCHLSHRTLRQNRTLRQKPRHLQNMFFLGGSSNLFGREHKRWNLTMLKTTALFSLRKYWLPGHNFRLRISCYATQFLT